MKISIGQKVNRLTALEDTGKRTLKGCYEIWKFRCDCGQSCEAVASLVLRQLKKSCGCMQHEPHHFSHLKKFTRVYSIWSGLKQRCLNSKHIAFSRYGGRGITLCKRWLKFENFFKDMGDPPGKEYTLDRLNNNQGYTKSNCRWATKKEQNRNARTNINYTLDGYTKCLSAWAEDYSKPYLIVWERVRKSGWPLRRALTEAIHAEKSRS